MNLTAEITDKANALECLSACEEVYNTDTLHTDECHVLISELPNCILIAFRGSKSAQDWLDDLEVPMLTISGGKVHEGFWYSYTTISALLGAYLRGLSKLPLVVTGHSLGAAHATLFTYNQEVDFPINRVITFGSPRVGNHQFTDSYNYGMQDKTVRYVDARDIVPRVPFRDLGYVHVGHEAFLRSAGGMAFDPGIWELLTDDVKGAVTDIRAGHPELLNDHHLPRYRARIEALT